MANKNELYIDPTFPSPETNPETSRRRVGGSAMLHFEDSASGGASETTPASGGFEHLFPAVQVSHLLEEASTAEGAERLLDKLEDDDPYKNYVLSELALHFMNQGELQHAYDLLHRITDSGSHTAASVLSQLVMYQDDHNIETISRDLLSQELHKLVVDDYTTTPSAQSARALTEASEALPEDKDLRIYARKVIKEHPEILTPVG